MAEALAFPAGGSAPAAGLDVRLLVDGGTYDLRRIVAAPSGSNGPGRYAGDAAVCVLSGSVEFTVDGRVHRLGPRDALWVPAGASRGFTAGPEGAELLAVHLPAGHARGGGAA
jgi:quercetin dioxygenase-like cupin family protein